LTIKISVPNTLLPTTINFNNLQGQLLQNRTKQEEEVAPAESEVKIPKNRGVLIELVELPQHAHLPLEEEELAVDQRLDTVLNHLLHQGHPVTINTTRRRHRRGNHNNRDQQVLPLHP
jgi:hypothetical protein